MERQIHNKRAEQRRVREQIDRMKIKIAEMIQKLQSKEAVMDSITNSLEMLLDDYDKNAVE